MDDASLFPIVLAQSHPNRPRPLPSAHQKRHAVQASQPQNVLVLNDDGQVQSTQLVLLFQVVVYLALVQ